MALRLPERADRVHFAAKGLTPSIDGLDKVNQIVTDRLSGANLHEHGPRCKIRRPRQLSSLAATFQFDPLNRRLYDFPGRVHALFSCGIRNFREFYV
jgi:hypothetical protein